MVGLAGDLKLQQIRSHRLTVRTTGFHPVNVGSTPAGSANSDVAQLVEPLAVNQLVARSSRAIRANLILTALSHCALAIMLPLIFGSQLQTNENQVCLHPTIAECSRGSFPVS